MKSILIIGIGRFGSETALKFSELGHEVMAIDSMEERINKVLPYVTAAQIGDTTDEDFLRSIGVSNFDLCIVAIGDEFQDSIVTTSYLNQLGAKYVVARASSDIQAELLLKNGANAIVYPEKQLGDWVAMRYSYDNIFDCIEIDKECCVVEAKLPFKWIGKSVGELDIRRNYKINIIGRKDEKTWNMEISRDTLFEKDDIILICGRNSDIHKCFK